jgi:hypothetical protein
MKLALLASLAARVEPELLRKLRLELLPEAGADAEADFWFSDFVEARSTSWLVLAPEKAEALRERCAVELTESERQRARAVIVAAHAQASPLVQLEDELHWHTMRRDEAAIDAILKSIVEALHGTDAIAVARWALRTLPRLSSWVRQLPAAWAVRLVADQQLGHALRIEPGAPNVPPEVWPLLRGALTPTEIWARLTAEPRGLELSREPLLGGNAITVPLTDPLILRVQNAPVTVPRTGSVHVPAPGVEQMNERESQGRYLALIRRFAEDRRSDYAKVAKEKGRKAAIWAMEDALQEHRMSLRAMDGSEHSLIAAGEPRNFVTFRFLLISGMYAVDAAPTAVEYQIAEHLRREPVDAIFVAGGLTMRGSSKQFEAVVERIKNMRRAAGATPVVLLLPGENDDVREFLVAATHLDPPSIRRSANPGDFAATLVHHGAFIGVAGCRSFENYLQLEQAIGRGLQEWQNAHHVTILLTATTPQRDERQHPFTVQLTGHESKKKIKRSLIVAPLLSDRYGDRASRSGYMVGALEIGARTRLRITQRNGRTEKSYGHIPLPTHIPLRQSTSPKEWILVAGSARKLSQNSEQTARALGAALANAGYGLATGGWRGIDEEVTAGYVAAYLGAPDTLHDAIRHYVSDRVEPRPSLPGRRLFFDADHRAVTRSVEDATAVVLIAGIGGTEWIGEEAIRQQRRLLPIAATGGAAAKMAADLPIPAELRDVEATPQQLAAITVEAIRNPVHVVQMESLASEERVGQPTIEMIPPKPKGGSRKKGGSSKKSGSSSKRASKKK